MALTKYPEGSLKELCGVSIPLVLFSFSSVLMFFLDRLFLARYSLDALNAVSNGGTLMWGFATGFYILASMAEVFVAQFNGAGLSHKLGQPVWQMIWFSLLSIFFFVPIAHWGTEMIYKGSLNEEMTSRYFAWMMYSGATWPLIAALSAFFIGQGKTKVIIYLIVVANISNIILDVVFIFGIEGIIPSMGIIGAALSSVINQSVQIIFLSYLFLKKSNRVLYGTGDWKFRPALFRKCFRIGFPQALLETFVVLGWAAYYRIMTEAGVAFITIASICHSIFLLFSFIGEGIYKGVAAISGNFIGAKKLKYIPKVFRSGVKFHLVCFVLISTVMLIYPEPLINQFLPVPEPYETPLIFTFGQGNLTQHEFVQQLRVCLAFMLFYLLFENISWVFSGILSAAGDTMYIFIAGSISIWVFLITPIYYFVVVRGSSVWIAYLIMAIYSLITCCWYGWRYSRGKWKKIDLMEKAIKSSWH
ncbi:MAG: MATE family efflux transporter [Parachlamydiales bacterium]|nr:MATE family efflux transporter [Parachlamydiales bacterium]